MLSFSIITICLNNEETIEKTICSVLNQVINSNMDVEYIIKDGSSKDGTNQIIKTCIDLYSNNKIHIRHYISQDCGVYDAMNQALDLCGETDYCLFINSGDSLFDKNVISTLSRLEFAPSPDIMIGATNTILSNGGSFVEKPVFSDINHRFCHQSVLIKTALMKTVRFDTKYTIAADRDAIYKIYFQNRSLELLNIIIASFEKNGISSSDIFTLYNEINEINLKYGISKRRNMSYGYIKTLILRIFPVLGDIAFVCKRLKKE